MTPLISVVIPSFNKVKYIGKTIRSILDQNVDGVEIIIQDGGSYDGTLDIIKKYAVKYPNIVRYESKHDGGQLNAINIGLKKAKGKLLTFINADDYYEDGALSVVCDAYRDNPDSMWFAGRGKIVNKNGNNIFRAVSFYKDLLLRVNLRFILLITNYLVQPCVFVTRKAYDIYGPFTGTKDFVLEYELWLKIARDQMPVIIGSVLSNFRIENETKTVKMSRKILDHDQKVVERYSKNKLILYLHMIHNKIRLLLLKTYE